MAEQAQKESTTVDKSRKYDRQLRLWGDHGQAALEAARVCLINASATGTEILKNLILPGIGSFTIVDGNKVKGEDVGNNFFLEKDSIGKSRAQTATELLLELNEDVNGAFMDENPDNLLDNNPAFFTSFSLVIATDLPERTLLKLSSVLWESDTPLLVCRSYGFIGYIRIALREHTVVESHPDNAHEDLRLDRPFPALIQYCDSLQLDRMNKKEHSHTPWLVIIYKYLEQWKQEHGGEGPKNYREKNQLKELIRQGKYSVYGKIRDWYGMSYNAVLREKWSVNGAVVKMATDGILKNEEGVPEDEENFDEAITHLNPSLVPTRIPDEVRQLFEDERCNNLTSESKSFWILTRALKDFVNNEGNVLPLRGSIPDMTSDSERYIQLQNIFKDQANEDVAIVTNYVHQHLQAIGRDEPLVDSSPRDTPTKTQDCISEGDIKLFCRNASFLRAINTRSVQEEYNPGTAKISEIAMHLEDADEDDIVFYVLLRAVDRFHAEYNRYPGYYHDNVEADIPKLKTCLSRLLQDWGLAHNIKDDFVHELCRYGAAEIHSVAAFMGGSAAQEAIKVITHQFVPINNTYIYNAMKQTSTTIKL